MIWDHLSGAQIALLDKQLYCYAALHRSVCCCNSLAAATECFLTEEPFENPSNLLTVFMATADKDLNITKTVDESTVMLGTPFTYTITITNKAALATAENAYAVDTLPAGLQVVTTALPAGESCIRKCSHGRLYCN